MKDVMDLTDKEVKLIKILEKREETMYITYIIIGLLYGLSLFGVIIGIQRHVKGAFSMSLYFGTMALIITICLRVQQRLLQIIKKLRANK